MNATMVASETKSVPPVVSSIQDIPIAKIRESKTNPRRFFDEAKLAELATTSENTASSNRFSCVRFPKGKRARMSLWLGHAATEHPDSQNARASPRPCAN